MVEKDLGKKEGNDYDIVREGEEVIMKISCDKWLLSSNATTAKLSMSLRFLSSFSLA